eukprot:NODE_111_length_18624_cov_1.285020.p13 type:complete len:153 gc:universal NODE_111_length_18624_cov_1.285020:11272-11730(+)
MSNQNAVRLMSKSYLSSKVVPFEMNSKDSIQKEIDQKSFDTLILFFKRRKVVEQSKELQKRLLIETDLLKTIILARSPFINTFDVPILYQRSQILHDLILKYSEAFYKISELDREIDDTRFELELLVEDLSSVIGSAYYMENSLVILKALSE